MYEIIKLIVPEGKQFIGEWVEYELPKGEHCIVDKGVTGCGYTEFCLTNPDNVILCSPRKLLLENKRDQHALDKNILYLENVLTKDGLVDFPLMANTLSEHLRTCKLENLPCKVMVTYDSLKHIVNYLMNDPYYYGVNDFVYVVDEFQCIFLDAFFKAEVEMDFVEILSQVKSVVYLSATPMLTKYLVQLDEFKDLKYYELDWSQTGYVEKLTLKRKQITSITMEAISIIEQYQKGNFPKKFINGRWYESREAVFYVNSITDIIRIVNKAKLTPADTVIICSNLPENRRKLRKIGFKIGTVPLKDEPNPMFMFCTKSVYVGVDMYSDCASSYIFSDPNIDSLALDIALDLPQIVGRQRRKENMFKNEISIYYKITKDNKDLSYDRFLAKKQSKLDSTQKGLELWEMAGTKSDSYQLVLKTKFLSDIKVSKYSNDFLSFSHVTGQPVHNKLIELADERAWEVIQKDYQDNVSVTSALNSVAEETGGEVVEIINITMKKIDEFCNLFFTKYSFFNNRLKIYCEFRDELKNNEEDTPTALNYLNARIKDDMFNYFYSAFGTEGCRAKGYASAKLKTLITENLAEDKLRAKICSVFSLNKNYSYAEAKEMLRKIYTELGLTKKTPKATDLKKYYKTARATLFDGTKKINGLKLIDYAKED